jgi:2-methylcitrate dehydratase PrpD
VLTDRLAEHIATASTRPLPDEVAAQTTLHILDTIAAMVSGSELPAGRKAIPFVQALGGARQASVVGSQLVTTAINAALANGMLAHADETDDSHAPSLTHPGCTVVPAALAVAESGRRSGRDLQRAVAAGYDVGTRIAAALGGGRFFDRHHSSHAVGGVFGATAAAGALTLDRTGAGHAIAYAVQLASGNTCWRRDPDHVEKSFIFGGMPAQGGVLAARMAAAGFTGSSQPLEGTPGLFAAFPLDAQPELATEELGQRFEVMRTSIKKWSVGSPIQSALDALSTLVADYRFGADDIEDIIVTLPRRRVLVVENRTTPDLNLAHQLAVLLKDGALTFGASHDRARMADPDILAIRRRIRVEARDVEEGGLAHVTVRLANGQVRARQSAHVRGTPGNPMSEQEIVAKAHSLMAPVMGTARTGRLIDALLRLESMEDIRALRPLLRRGSRSQTSKSE